MSTNGHRGKVLVTGAAGHLGANLVRRLLDDGHDVRVFLREGANNQGVDGLAVERAYGDLRDAEAVRQAVRGCERVFHCAANVSTLQGSEAHKREVYVCNVTGTRSVLAAAKEFELARVVVTGSFSAVGYDLDDPTKPAAENEPFYPFARHLPYGHTKLLVEHECLKAAADGLDVVVCTSTAILGPHDYKPSRMGQLLLDFTQKKLRAYIPGGFEFVAARDICEGHVLCMEKGRRGQKYIIATQFVTVDEIFDLYEEVTGVARPKLRLPAGAMQALSYVADFLMRTFAPGAEQRFTPDAVRILRLQRHADTSKARNELGFRPSSLRDAIAEAYDDFARRGLLPERPSAPLQRKVSPRPEASV
jgi:3beta-hydroxysteroid-4beta-carboxylate 3-dehydrogenase (decarboxylating)